MQGLGVVNIVATRDSVNNNARSLHLKTEGEKHRNEVFVCICSESALEIKWNAPVRCESDFAATLSIAIF